MEFIEEKLILRKAQPGDQIEIARFQLAMALETESLNLDPNTVNLGVGAVIADPSKGTYFVGELEGRLVSVLLTVPEWSDWRNGTVLWIHSLYVIPKLRGQGLYGKMYRHLKALVESSKEYRGLRLYVDKRNLHAQKIYEKLGMSADHYQLYEWLKT